MSRTIDADVLMNIYANRLELLKIRYGWDSTECGVLAGAMKLLETQPTIEPERPTLEQNTHSEQGKSDKFGVKMGETCTNTCTNTCTDTCKDTISRQAAIDALSTPHGILYPIRTVEELPSAQPQPEEDCDTCKHGYFGDRQCDNCRVRYPSHYEREEEQHEGSD